MFNDAHSSGRAPLGNFSDRTSPRARACGILIKRATTPDSSPPLHRADLFEAFTSSNHFHFANMQIPTEPVGSLPRPIKLQEAIAKLDRGEIQLAELQELQDQACKDSIERFAKTGSPIICDGEQRCSRYRPLIFTNWIALTQGGMAHILLPPSQFRDLPCEWKS